jgi:predicted XRE-type DNA-binding protein
VSVNLNLCECGLQKQRTIDRLKRKAVLEIVSPHEGDTWRTVYTVRFQDAVWNSSSSDSGSPRQSGITEKGRTEMRKNSRIRVKEGSGNVFRDLGFPNPEREQVKARLTLQIYRLIKGRGLTQAAAGEILGIKQPHVSSLMRGQSGNFSVERLMDFLTALGQDVEITVRPTHRGHGELSLILA